MKFRKIPVIVDAVEFTGELPYPDGVTGRYIDPVGRIEDGIEKEPRMVLDLDFAAVVNTLEGVMRAHKGDWIITGVEGEKYPCKPDIFRKTYEQVTDSNEALPQ
jgi:hypothetical protein